MTDHSAEENDRHAGPSSGLSPDGPFPDGPFPDGPWVLIVGMHRSGTSAVTGAIGALGGMSMSRPDDRIRPAPSNPEHWESHSIMLFSEDVLDRLGGSWDAPPRMEPGWVHAPELRDLPDPAPVFADVYPDPGPIVWKDPRVCLLLPYWRLRIPEPVAAVFVWRSPEAVARSLQSRDGLSLTHGLALWEHYNRQALDGLRGTEVFVTTYEALIDDPPGVLGSVVEWLASLDQLAPHAGQWDLDRASSFVAADHRHQVTHPPSDGLLLPEERSLMRLLSELGGGHRPFDPGSLPELSPWAADVLASRREARLSIRRESEVWERVADRVHRINVVEAELAEVTGRLEQTREQLEQTREQLEQTLERVDRAEQLLASTRAELDWTKRMVAAMESSTSWRMTKPLRSLVAGTEGLAARVRGPGHARGGTG